MPHLWEGMPGKCCKENNTSEQVKFESYM